MSRAHLLLIAGAWLSLISFACEAHADGTAPIGTQPTGGLTGKIIYTHGGHGITADNKGNGKWAFQRGEGFEMIEDLGNIDQMTFLVDYLFRAGATIAPLRPVGHQTNEVVLDNNDPGVEFSGGWTAGAGPIYFGKDGSVPYKQARTSKTETATARFTPDLPESGFYPVYAWTSSGGDRPTDQLYRVHHAGGATEVKVNHRRVGNGLVYLGTYYFEAGKNGSVAVSNKSNDEGSLAVADTIRFGNGMGDIDRSGGISGLAREDEAGLYWVKWHVDRSQGISEKDYRETDVDRQATISLSPRYAHFMNRESDGRLKDRVFVSFHSNAGGGGKARGVFGLLNGNNDPTTATPNQLLLAKSLAQKLNDDMVAQNGQFEHNWHDRGQKTTLDRDDIDFGEINNRYIKGEFDATIVEVAFHDNKEDAELMRDPRARDAMARAVYQGLLTYFRTVDNNETPATRLPAAVTDVRAGSNASGEVTISWKSPAASSYQGDAATGYRVYTSTNGYGFDGGAEVNGGNVASTTVKGLTAGKVYYFKLVAVNEGGESPASEVVAALPAGAPKNVLFVNGFDRIDRELDPKQPYRKAGNTIDRVRPRESNSRDYIVQVATAIESAAPGTHLDSSSNEAVASGAVDLNKYRTVVWSLGEESTKDHTLDEVEQKLIAKFIAGGGNLFVSGAKVAWDLDHEDNGPRFFETLLKSKFVSEAADVSEVAAAKDGIFSGMPSMKLDAQVLAHGGQPDIVSALAGGSAALNYGEQKSVAGVQAARQDGRGSVVYLAFPFERIASPADRAEVMKRVLKLFEQASPAK